LRSLLHRVRTGTENLLPPRESWPEAKLHQAVVFITAKANLRANLPSCLQDPQLYIPAWPGGC
jgi:hypothetical protein